MTKEEEILKSILLEKNPILFLGAGFSVGAMQKDGEPVPAGRELKEKYLIEKLLKLSAASDDYKELADYSLSALCNYIDDEGLKTQKNDLLIEIFKDVIPNEEQVEFFRYNWHKIYTTNIDDMVENIYSQLEKGLRVQNSSMKKEEMAGQQTGSCEYFKLHGCVNNPDEGFVFSTKEYVASMQSRVDYRFSEFCQDIQTEDFILIGTAFDEINIDYFLQLYENAGQSARGTLIFVNPSPNLALRSRIKRMNGVLLEWTWKELLTFMEQIDFSSVEQNRYWEQRMQLKNFHSIAYYEELYHKSLMYHSNLYYGEEPSMLDILTDWDFVDPKWKNWTEEITEATYSGCISLVGKRLVGKSCAALRILYELHKKGFQVYDYVSNKFEGQVILDYIKQSRNERFVFYLDEGAYYYREIASVLNRYHGEKQLLFLVSSSRSNHHKWKYYLSKVKTREISMDGKIDDECIDEILDKLRKHGQLGRLGGMEPAQQRQELQESEDLMSFLASLGGADSFWSRYKDVLEECVKEKKENQRLFALLFLFDQCDLPYFPATYLPMLFGAMSKDLLNRTSDLHRSYRNVGYRLRGSQYGGNMRAFVTNELLIDEIEHLCQVLAPQVTEHEKTYSKNILENMLKAKTIYRKFTFTEQQKNAYKEMLYRLQKYFERISYYWIELGLAEQVSGDYNRALTHFQHAKSIRPGSYSVLHAIARNYIRQAINLPKREKELARSLFEQGEQKMLDLIREQEYEQNIPYSIHTYLLEKIHFCRKFQIIPSDDELRHMLSLCKELEEWDDKEVYLPVKKKFYHYLAEIKRQDILQIVQLQDLGLFVERSGYQYVLPEDPEED